MNTPNNVISETTMLPLFSYYSKPIGNVLPCAKYNLLQLYNVIRNPEYFQEQTNELRSIIEPAKRREFK
jgi:hypothetical protein